MRAGGLFAERMTHVPEAEIEPGPRVGRADRVETEQIADRAFQPDRRRMARGDARILSGLAGVADDGDVAGCLVQQRHVHRRRVAPQAEQRAAAGRELIDRLPPAVLGHDRARPRPVPLGRLAMRDGVEQGHGAIPTAWRRSGSR